MSYVIIGVHGFANKPPKEKHAQDWVSAIQEGLTRNCSLTVQSINFTSAYWAHVNYANPLDSDPEPYISTPSHQPIKKYRDGFLSLLRAYSSDVPGDMIQKGKEWLGHDPAADYILDKKLKDLGKYYRSEENRQALRGLVKDVIEGEKNNSITLIAHSMGSIIAYDALRALGQINRDIRVENFVTIGSPLGLPTIAAKMYDEWKLLRTPSIVKRWINFSDPRDPVAFDTYLGNDYEANDQGVKVKDDLILNNYVRPDGKPNHHKVYGYLRCPEMSELIRGIL